MKNEATNKIIFHIDMNAFFCTVAEIKDPSLRGKAFAIGRKESLKGVISTASYEARKYGIHSAMPLKEAYRLLPSLLVIDGDYTTKPAFAKIMKVDDEKNISQKIKGKDDIYGSGDGDRLVNINKATRDELMTLPGIGGSKADDIISYREEHGKFSKIEDLMNISGIKTGVFNKIKDMITI